MLSKKTAGKCWRFCLKKLCFTSDLDDLDFEASGLQGFEGICSRKVCVLFMFSTWNSTPTLWANWIASKKPAGWGIPRKSRGRHFPTCLNIQALGIFVLEKESTTRKAWKKRRAFKLFPVKCHFPDSPPEVDNGVFPFFWETELHLPDFQQKGKTQIQKKDHKKR